MSETTTVTAAKLSSLALVGLMLLAGCSSEESADHEPTTESSSEAIGAAGIEGAGSESGGEPSPDASQTPKSTDLNDTGVVFAGNHPRTVNEEACEGVINPDDEWVEGETFDKLTFTGQDCDYGRDARFPDDSDGHAGFSFVKIDSNGERLPAEANSWSCVLDQVTGLMWESKAPMDEIPGNAGLHDADDKFSHYDTNTNTNGGHIGNWNKDWSDCHGYQEGQPATFCNTQSFAERVNAAKLCGYSDWRVPKYDELMSIVNYARVQPAAEMTYFPNTQPWPFWTASVVAWNPELARYINYEFGITAVGYRTDTHFVRLVRSANQ